MSQVDVLTQIDIKRSVDVVSTFSGNPDNVPHWYVNIHSVDWKSSPPAELGSQIAFVASFMGRELRYTYEVVEFDLPRRMVMRTAEGPFPMETSYQWEAIDENTTRMSLRNRGLPVGFSRLMVPFIKPMMRRANQKDLQALKAYLESN